MKKVKLLIAAFMVAVLGTLALAPAGSVSALDPSDPLAEACKLEEKSAACDASKDNANDLINRLVNTLLFVVGSLAVIMIIVGGIMYATSAGDSGRITKAKNTIMYSIVGLIVSFLAYAIVNWVVKVL